MEGLSCSERTSLSHICSQKNTAANPWLPCFKVWGAILLWIVFRTGRSRDFGWFECPEILPNESKWLTSYQSRTRISAPLCCFLGLESSYQSLGMSTTRRGNHCACRLPTKHLESCNSLCSGKCIYCTCLRTTHSISFLLLWQSSWDGATPRQGASFFLPHAQQCLLGDSKFNQVGRECNAHPEWQCLSLHFFYLWDFKLSSFGASKG